VVGQTVRNRKKTPFTAYAEEVSVVMSGAMRFFKQEVGLVALLLIVLVLGAGLGVLSFGNEKLFYAFTFGLIALILSAHPASRLFVLVGLIPYAHLGLAQGLGGFGIYDVYNLIFLCVFFARLLFADLFSWRKIPVLGWAAIMVISFVPSLMNAPELGNAFKWMVHFVVSAATAAGVYYYLTDEGHEKIKIPLMKFMVLEAAVVAGVSVYQSRGQSLLELATGRAGFEGLVDVNYYAAYLVMCLPLAMAFVIIDRKWYSKLLFVISSALISVGIIATVSRSGMLALILVVISFAIYMSVRAKGSFKLVGGVIIAGFVAFIYVLAFTDFGKQLVDLFTLSRRVETVIAGRDVSLGQRERILTVGFRIAESNPLIGVGFGNFEKAFNVYRGGLLSTGSARSTHNSALRIFAETGIIGLLPSVMFVGSLLLFLWKGLKSARGQLDHTLMFGLIVSIGSFVFMSFTLDALFEPEFWVITGLALAVASEIRKSKAVT
jgi:hypothetical protein